MSTAHRRKTLAKAHHGIHQQMGATLVVDGIVETPYCILLVGAWCERHFIACVMKFLWHSSVLHRVELITPIVLVCAVGYVVNGFVNV